MINCPICGSDVECYRDKNNIISLDGHGNTMRLKYKETDRFIHTSCENCGTIMPVHSHTKYWDDNYNLIVKKLKWRN